MINSGRLSISLTTRITITFIVIGFFFLLTMLLGYWNSNQVSSGLRIINDESAPVMANSSEINSLVLATESLVLKLTNSRTSAEYTLANQDLTTNVQAISDSFTGLETLSRSESISKVVAGTVSQLKDKVSEIKVDAAGLSARHKDIVELVEYSETVIAELNGLQATITPLLQQTLLDLDQESVISIVNEINASITYGLLVIERIGAASSPSEIEMLRGQFVGWQNVHSNLLPSLIFASQDESFQRFVRQLSQLTLSLLDGIEGDRGLLQIQTSRLDLEVLQQESYVRLQSDIMAASSLTKQLLDDSFKQNNLLSSEINKASNQHTRFSLIVGILMLAGITAVAFWITMTIRNAMKNLMKEMDLLSKGNLRNIERSHSEDEFGRLNNYLLQVVDGLKQVVTGIESSARQVEQSVDSVSNSSSDTRQIVEQQKIELDSIAAALVEMNMVAQDVAKHTENTHEKIVEAGQFARDGRTQMLSSRESVDKMAEQTKQMIDVINKVDEGVRSIEGIIETIENIAEQTNLLALNAAIEAARAGDQGRGFAVVSDEVRSLANRTQESTLEIQTKITSMISDSRVAVQVIRDSETLVLNSSEQAKLADETIGQFDVKMGEIQDLSHLISTATEEQVRTVDELERNLTQITILADQTNVQAEKAEGEAKAQVKIVEELDQKLSQFTIER